MTYKELKEDYKQKQDAWKEKIKSKPTKWLRFWGWVWYLIAFAWVWIWYNCKSWKTLLLFFIVMAVVGIEVWLPALLGLICKGTEFGTWCLSVAGACETFWLLPATPFIPLCIFITMGIQAIINKIKDKKMGKKVD